MFILASSVCKSLQCLISTLTQGGEDGHLFRLTYSIVLWGGRNTANKYHWHVWGVLPVSGPHGVCPHSACVISQSTLLRLQVVLQGNCLKRELGCVHFPGLSCSGSGSQVLHKGAELGWACVLCPSQVRAAQATRCLVSAVSPGGECVLSPPRSQPLGFLGDSGCAHLQCAVCLFWGADLWL